MKLKNYLSLLCQEDVAKKYNIRIHGLNFIVSDITKEIRLANYTLRKVCNQLNVPSRTFHSWKHGNSPIPIPYLLDLLEIWKIICNKDQKDIDQKLDYIFEKAIYFSVAQGYKAILPKEMTINFAYILGYLLGDGCLKDYRRYFVGKRKSPEYSIHFASTTREFAQNVIIPKFSNVFNVSLKIYNVANENCFIATVCSKTIYYFLHKICDIPSGKKKNKMHLPNIILNSSSEFQAAFIAGFFDADGTVYTPNQSITIDQADSCFLAELKQLIENLGIQMRGMYQAIKKEGITYAITVRRNSISLFNNTIPIKNPIHIPKLNLILEKRKFLTWHNK